MKTTSLLMKGPLVLASLRGDKTQTRRIITAGYFDIEERDDGSLWPWRYDTERGDDHWYPCPYGQPGDLIWIKETFHAWGRWETRFDPGKGRDAWHFVDMTLESGRAYQYPINGDHSRKRQAGILPTWWKRPSIFMPRAASRLTLRLTDVRVQRLQEISDGDAFAEGIAQTKYGCHEHAAGGFGCVTGRDAFAALWDSINGAGAWDRNEWVWALTFDVLRANVDQVLREAETCNT